MVDALRIYSWIVLIFFISTACSSTETDSASEDKLEQEENMEAYDNHRQKYSIVKSEEIAEDLFHYWVMVDDIYLSEDDIRHISHEVVDEVKDEHDFSQLILFFVENEKDVERGFNIANVRYGPTVEAFLSEQSPGNYENHEYTYTFGSEFIDGLPINVEKYPSEEEKDIIYYFLDVYEDKVVDYYLSHDDDEQFKNMLLSEVADHFGVSVERIAEVITTFMGEYIQ